MEEKIKSFEYLVGKFIHWYSEVAPFYGYKPNDYEWAFSKLTILKLLFLVSAVEEDEKDLLNTFNNFVALPHGPVESDIYNAMNNNKVINYNITENGLTVSNRNASTDLSEEQTNRLDLSINKLKEINKAIVTYKPFDLVDITHRWSCWKNDYNVALNFGLRAMSMTSESIRNSDKYFDL
ncbi:type II toxin-antitoxin system antitoxin SocA domain-containing protein [Dysgonomonas sp. GY617]|uniref:type II toxin-antitoxin system antitoxin SocA domain-containing protein n=1 Tax=Dysgonomonas sp. GY617 TaxID=2780420 RepID=UPI0018840296|nr:type II toxin-antitoxin system antitoxin SocA domain-containing protein [Dysgonomonas sp. GY617]MBF0576383.1 DUF4065 domain-containing protein [Dysgonomonas sp. GY617]